MKEIVSIGDDPERRKRGGEFSFGIERGREGRRWRGARSITRERNLV